VRPPDENVSWFVAVRLSSATGAVGQLHRFTWKLAIRPSNVANPLNKQFHNGGWEHSPPLILKDDTKWQGRCKGASSRRPCLFSPRTQWIRVPAGPACSLFNIPTELSRLHTLRFVYSGIMDEWWSGSDSGTMRSWPNRNTTICLGSRNQPGTPYYLRTALRLYEVAGSYNQTSHLCPSCNYPRSEVWRLTDIFECPSILNPPITFALITILRFTIASYSSFYDRQKKFQLKRTKRRRTENKLSFSSTVAEILPT